MKLQRLVTDEHADVYLKLEYMNHGSSVKDRIALSMIEDAEEKGRIKPGDTIVEPTSGNTGIGIAMVAAAKGYKTIIVMPETMSLERRNLLRAYGAELVLTPGPDGMGGAIAKANELADEHGYFLPQQFENEANPKVHRETTGVELLEQVGDQLDAFVAGIGTGGTITGIARGLKEYHKDIQIIGVEPLQSAVINGRPKGAHKIQGIGAGFIPSILDLSLIDEVLMIDGDEAMAESRMLAKTQGILCGISAGAALLAAEQVGSRPENEGKRIVVILPDTGERYLSTELFRESN